MKDPVHHVNKINRQVLRTSPQEVEQGIARPQTERQLKKQAKQKVREAKLARPSSLLTPEEQNKKMLHRVPVFEPLSHDKAVKGNKPTRKKTPRI